MKTEAKSLKNVRATQYAGKSYGWCVKVMQALQLKLSNNI